MKLKLLFITLLIISGFNIYSQNFNGGIITGITASQISGDQLSGFDKLGLNLGGFVNIPTTENTAFQMELAFVQKGSASHITIFDTTAAQRKLYRLRLNYIELPFIFRYDIKSSPANISDTTHHVKNRLSIEAGLAYAVLLSSNEEDYTGTFTLYTPPFNKGDLSMLIGLYYSLSEKVRVNFRWTSSLLPVRSHSGGGTYRLNRGQYNDVLEFSLRFQLNKRIRN